MQACVRALFTVKLPEQSHKINKPRSQAGIRRWGHGQHFGEADNKAGGSDNTSDNT